MIQLIDLEVTDGVTSLKGKYSVNGSSCLARLERCCAGEGGDEAGGVRNSVSCPLWPLLPNEGTREIRVILYAKEPSFRTSAFAVSQR